MEHRQRCLPGPCSIQRCIQSILLLHGLGLAYILQRTLRKPVPCIPHRSCNPSMTSFPVVLLFLCAIHILCNLVFLHRSCRSLQDMEHTSSCQPEKSPQSSPLHTMYMCCSPVSLHTQDYTHTMNDPQMIPRSLHYKAHIHLLFLMCSCTFPDYIAHSSQMSLPPRILPHSSCNLGPHILLLRTHTLSCLEMIQGLRYHHKKYIPYSQCCSCMIRYHMPHMYRQLPRILLHTHCMGLY